MRLEGGARLRRKLSDLPDGVRAEVKKAVRRNVNEGERVANVLAPDVTFETRGNIHTDFEPDGMSGRVIGIRSDAPKEDKDRQYSIEHGRKKGVRGTTAGFHFMHRTRKYLRKRWSASLRRAVRAAAKRSFRG